MVLQTFTTNALPFTTRVTAIAKIHVGIFFTFHTTTVPLYVE